MFRAIQISKTEQGQKVDFVNLEESDLMDGDVTIAGLVSMTSSSAPDTALNRKPTHMMG